MPRLDKVLMRKGRIIETLFDKLKSAKALEHSMHRSPISGFVYTLPCLIAYRFCANKPKNATVLSMKA